MADQEKLTYELNNKVDKMIAELETATENNERLGEVASNQKTEIELQKQKISGLIRNKANLNKAKQEITDLESRMSGYLAEINKLKEEIGELSEENSELSTANSKLNQDVVEAKEVNDDLLVSKGILESEKEKLSQSNDELSSKVTKASAINMSLGDIHGTRVKSSGALAKTSRASKMSGLQICLDLENNALVSGADEMIFLRVISPIGETISLGTDKTFTSKENDQSVRYSASFEIMYDGAKQECLLWEPEIPFHPGAHTIEVYNRDI